jgi:putative endonuclease
MFFVYVLRSSRDRHLYTGYTGHLRQRFEEHSQGRVSATRDRRPLKLIYYEACLNVQDALHREKYLKTAYGKKFLKSRLMHYLAETTA